MANWRRASVGTKSLADKARQVLSTRRTRRNSIKSQNKTKKNSQKTLPGSAAENAPALPLSFTLSLAFPVSQVAQVAWANENCLIVRGKITNTADGSEASCYCYCYCHCCSCSRSRSRSCCCCSRNTHFVNVNKQKLGNNNKDNRLSAAWNEKCTPGHVNANGRH